MLQYLGSRPRAFGPLRAMATLQVWHLPCWTAFLIMKKRMFQHDPYTLPSTSPQPLSQAPQALLPHSLRRLEMSAPLGRMGENFRREHSHPPRLQVLRISSLTSGKLDRPRRYPLGCASRSLGYTESD